MDLFDPSSVTNALKSLSDKLGTVITNTPFHDTYSAEDAFERLGDFFSFLGLQWFQTDELREVACQG